MGIKQHIRIFIDTIQKKNRNYQILAEQLEAILDHIPALIFYKDRANNFIKVNKYVAQTHKKELEGTNLANLYPKQDAESYYQDNLSVINSGTAKLNIDEPWKTPGRRKMG